jgi:hypothetical protein
VRGIVSGSRIVIVPEYYQFLGVAHVGDPVGGAPRMVSPGTLVAITPRTSVSAWHAPVVWPGALTRTVGISAEHGFDGSAPTPSSSVGPPLARSCRTGLSPRRRTRPRQRPMRGCRRGPGSGRQGEAPVTDNASAAGHRKVVIACHVVVPTKSGCSPRHSAGIHRSCSTPRASTTSGPPRIRTPSLRICHRAPCSRSHSVTL